MIEGIAGNYTTRAKERVGMLGAEGAFRLIVGVVRVRAACARRSSTDNSLVITLGGLLLDFRRFGQYRKQVIWPVRAGRQNVQGRGTPAYFNGYAPLFPSSQEGEGYGDLKGLNLQLSPLGKRVDRNFHQLARAGAPRSAGRGMTGLSSQIDSIGLRRWPSLM